MAEESKVVMVEARARVWWATAAEAVLGLAVAAAPVQVKAAAADATDAD